MCDTVALQGNPDDVLDAVANGLDVFDSGYVHEVSSQGYALSFPPNLDGDAKIDADSGQDDMKINLWAVENR